MALAALADGKNRAEAAAVGLMDRQRLGDWVIGFNADEPAGLIDKSSPGRPPKFTPAQKQEMRKRGFDRTVVSGDRVGMMAAPGR